MRKLLPLLLVPVVWLAPTAQADAGSGQMPSPGLCDYPATCGMGMIGAGVTAIYWYWADTPTELNGSHRHCQTGGAAATFNASVGVSFIMINASIGISAPLGGILGGCDYVCPSGLKAAVPNPPGGWKDAIRPTKCQPIGGPLPWDPPPPPEDAPEAPPIAEQGAVPAVPFGQPQSPVPGNQEPLIPPVVTNPVFPNPASTNNVGS